MPVLQGPSTMINTVEGKQVGCEKCGAWMRSDSTGKPVGRLAKPDLLRSKVTDLVVCDADMSYGDYKK